MKMAQPNTSTATPTIPFNSPLCYDDFGLLFALERDNNWYYITTDQLGTPRVVCDANGELIKVLEYDSFGQVIVDSYPEFELHISFAGGLIDVDTELVRFGFRDYDAVAGKWTAKDPIGFDGGDVNLYSYVFNSPVTWQDPLGLFRFCKRPLNGLLPFIGFGHSSFFDKHNIGLYHEYGRFEDGSTVGFDNKLGVTWREEPIGGFGYECEATLYDDDLMLQVINETEGGRYSLLGSPMNKKNNCQDWAAKLRINYNSMSFKP